MRRQETVLATIDTGSEAKPREVEGVGSACVADDLRPDLVAGRLRSGLESGD